jgi:fatty-acyl-CoA synthase
MLAVYFGASKAGVVPVPLNGRLAPAEWDYILTDADASLLIAGSDFTERLQEVALPDACRVAMGPAPDGWRSFESEVAAAVSTELFDRRTSADSPLYQMYTSGTTGSPKGAIVSHGAVIANIVQLHCAVNMRRSKAMVVMPLFHAGAAITSFAYTAGGTTLHLVRDFDAPLVIEILRSQGIRQTTLVPAMIQALLRDPTVTVSDYPDLEFIAYGASPIGIEVLRSAIHTFGCDFVQAYGMTELTNTATILSAEDHVRAVNGDARLLLSAGRPVVGTEIQIVDADDNEVASGEAGEVVVRGPQVMIGYHGLPDATAEALLGGWMHTGDVGHLDAEGFLFLSDRVKDMIVSGGENIYPRQIEDVLFRLPGVMDAAVIGIPDRDWGEAPKAVIVLDEGASITEADVLSHCRSYLASYKCPRSVDFVGELPRNATGKVLKRELRAPYWVGHDRKVH